MAVVSADKILPTKQSKAEDWIAWYNSFPWSMARADKNNLFLVRWRFAGSTSANTSDLRTFLNDEAGIELTTDGLGNVIDAGTSIIRSVESVFQVSGYMLMGIFGVWILIIVFGIYQAFKHPEATGTIIGAAGKVAMKV